MKVHFNSGSTRVGTATSTAKSELERGKDFYLLPEIDHTREKYKILCRYRYVEWVEY